MGLKLNPIPALTPTGPTFALPCIPPNPTLAPTPSGPTLAVPLIPLPLIPTLAPTPSGPTLALPLIPSNPTLAPTASGPNPALNPIPSWELALALRVNVLPSVSSSVLVWVQVVCLFFLVKIGKGAPAGAPYESNKGA